MVFADFQDVARRSPPSVAVILGSGMNEAASRVQVKAELPVAAAPGLAAPTVAGHAGRILLGDWAGRRVLVLVGRVHYYEGRTWDEVAAPVQLAAGLGARILVCTNAAGGIRDDLVPGSLMLLRDHIDWTQPCCWRQPARPSPYSPRLRDLLMQADPTLREGTYAAVTGPSYETLAEIRALKVWGADAVGMSTAREIQAGFDLGLECAAISLITNRAAGLSQGPIHHGEVLEHAAAAAGRMAGLLEAVLSALGAGRQEIA